MMWLILGARNGGRATCKILREASRLDINALALSDRHPTYHETPSDRVNMDDPNITMEEYIRLEEEKALKHRKEFNWETAKYGKIWYDEDVHDLRSIETEFPTIVISFDESDDEDYTVIYDKNSFSYKIIYVNDLKMDSEYDNDKVNMPSFSSPEPTQNARILELKGRYFEDYYSEDQYAVSIKEDTAYSCLHSPKTTKETCSIRCIQRRPIRRIGNIVCEDSGRYQTWSLLQETPNTPYPIPSIRRIELSSRPYK
ncbi:hypothetical protein Tco_1465051 [Tanacetum coccineum]